MSCIPGLKNTNKHLTAILILYRIKSRKLLIFVRNWYIIKRKCGAFWGTRRKDGGMEKLKAKLDNIPYGVYDGLSIISSVITLITAVWCVVKAVVTIQEVDGQFVIDLNTLLLLLCILVIMFSIVTIVKLCKYARIIRALRKSFTYNYYNAAHDLRNVYFDILMQHKKEESKDSVEILTTVTRTFLGDTLDYLCEILESLTGKEIHGCIKLIENLHGQSSEIDPRVATVKTFCRSKNTQPQRVSNDQVDNKSKRIYDNTDFYDILDSDNTSCNSCFYCSNLKEYEKHLRKSGKRYKNTTPDWEDYYRSTIVAPIRVANKRLFFNNLTSGYNVVGFLCVDSMSTEAFRNTTFEKENYSYIVKSFAAEVYIILNMYSYYLEQIKKENI